MGLLDSLFGGGGGGGSSGLDVQQYSTLTDQQRSLLDQLTSRLSGQLGQGVSPYGGQMVAPLSGLQQQGMGYYGGIAPIAQQGADIFGRALSSYDPAQGQGYLSRAAPAMASSLADYDPTSAREYWQQSFVNPAMQNYRQNVMPQLLERYAGQTGAGGMKKAIAGSGEDLATSLNAQLANILYSGQQAQKDRQLQAAGLSANMAQVPGLLAQQGGQLGGMGMDLMSNVMGAGQLQQTQAQNVLSWDYQKWLQSQAYNNPWLSQMPLALGIPAFENVGTASQASPSFMQSTGFPLLGSFMSSGVGQNMMGSMLGGLFGGGGGAAGGGAAGGGGMSLEGPSMFAGMFGP